MAAASTRRGIAGLFPRRRVLSFPYLHPQRDDESSHPRIPSAPPPPPPPGTSSVQRLFALPPCGKHVPLFPISSIHFSLRHYSSSGTADHIAGGDGGDIANVLDDASVIETVASSAAVGPPAPFPGEVAAAAADSFAPVAALQMLIDGVHSFTGLNWWACIALTTLLIRLATVPLMINTMKSSVKLAMIRPELEAIKNEMQNAADIQSQQESQRKVKALFAKHGVSPFSPLKGMFIQGPIFMSFFFAISNMVEKVPSFKGGGTLWFTDLTTPDALYIFPVLTSLTFLATVELNTQEGMEGNPMANTMKKFSRGLAVLTIPFTAGFPKAIFCYWVTSNLFSLVYGLAIKHPAVRNYLSLPDLAALQVQAPNPTHPLVSGPRTVESLLPLKVSEESDSSERKIASPAAISHRLRSLERAVKARSQAKRRR